MICTTSAVAGRFYGVTLVCRAWEQPRSSYYVARQAQGQPVRSFVPPLFVAVISTPSPLYHGIKLNVLAGIMIFPVRRLVIFTLCLAQVVKMSSAFPYQVKPLRSMGRNLAYSRSRNNSSVLSVSVILDLKATVLCACVPFSKVAAATPEP
jgi:hypothetical protein